MNLMLSNQDAEMLNAILADELGVAVDQIKPEAHLYRDLGCDSLTVIEIGMRLEEQFHLNLPDEDLDQLQTVADVHASLATALAQAPHS